MIQTKDLGLINRELRSVNYIMETKTIPDLIDSINTWLENSECGVGGIVYEKPRRYHQRCLILCRTWFRGGEKGLTQ